MSEQASLEFEETGYIHKYTNRDVQRDPDLHELATRYARTWSGDFQPLNEAQAMVSSGEMLPISTARIVLNCMHNDRDWAGKMPHPKRTDHVVVTYAPRKKRSARKGTPLEQCGNTEGHYAHQYEQEDGSPALCKGEAFRVNRPFTIQTLVSVKFRLARTKTGQRIHFVAPERVHEMSWFTNETHAEGNRTPDGIKVKTACISPSWIFDPIPLTVEETVRLNEFGIITLCARCRPFIEEEIARG